MYPHPKVAHRFVKIVALLSLLGMTSVFVSFKFAVIVIKAITVYAGLQELRRARPQQPVDPVERARQERADMVKEAGGRLRLQSKSRKVRAVAWLMILVPLMLTFLTAMFFRSSTLAWLTDVFVTLACLPSSIMCFHWANKALRAASTAECESHSS